MALLGAEIEGLRALRDSRPSKVAGEMPELHSEHDILSWRREYNIRQREADWKRRQDELLTQKQISWEIERCERQNRLASARETQRREKLEERVCERHAEVDRAYKDRCREAAIQKRTDAWVQRKTAEVSDMVRSSKEDMKAKAAQRAREKAEKCDALQAEASKRAFTAIQNEELNKKREENIKKAEAARQARAEEKARALKVDAVAKHEGTVSRFTERTVPCESTLVSILTQQSVGSHYSHFGASAAAIL
eukprot:gnl/TRDRNA2_/TRDRNA2_189058_c0_seq1.p1 gnl/TRDRNA2_/TRDRNA2_189058_c0~~gnl/TRDRNA2_/TRDRNA2_189058_c0_seq1.p1  ORF type:complete len:251 (+),score=65.76 gnl/TRDRNA2_/TRDRNA2_189058_c0_seq1:68-820(+)